MKHTKIFLLFIAFIIISTAAYAASDTLVIYYSRTGYVAEAAKTIATNIGADIQEIKEVDKDRTGKIGYYSAAWDTFWGTHSKITPEKVDLKPYNNLVICSPIWSWKLAMPLHAFFEKNKIENKSIVLVTVGNIDVLKYKDVGPNDNLVKRFFKDYLGGKKIKAQDEIQATMDHNQFVFHKHFWIQQEMEDPVAKKKVKVTKEKSELVAEVNSAMQQMKEALKIK